MTIIISTKITKFRNDVRIQWSSLMFKLEKYIRMRVLGDSSVVGKQ